MIGFVVQLKLLVHLGIIQRSVLELFGLYNNIVYINSTIQLAVCFIINMYSYINEKINKRNNSLFLLHYNNKADIWSNYSSSI